MPPSWISCTQHSHDDFKKSYETFRQATRHLAYDRLEGLIFANCKICGSTLAIPLSWEERLAV